MDLLRGTSPSHPGVDRHRRGLLPNAGARVQHVIDYAGIVALTISASALILFTSLGGTSLAWLGWKSVDTARGRGDHRRDLRRHRAALE